MPRSSALDALAREILGDTPAAAAGAGSASPRMTGSSGDAGNDEETRVRGLPLPLGDEGDILTVTVNGDGDTVAAWAPPAGAELAGTQYRAMIIADDGSGGWGFVEATIDGLTRPVTSLFDLE